MSHELVGDHHGLASLGLVAGGDSRTADVKPVGRMIALPVLVGIQVCVRYSPVPEVAVMEFGDRLARSSVDMGIGRQDKTGEHREHGAACRQRARHDLSLMAR